MNFIEKSSFSIENNNNNYSSSSRGCGNYGKLKKAFQVKQAVKKRAFNNC